MGATPTLSSLNENSFTSTIAAFESMHLPLTTSVTDCDHFSTTLVKNTVGSLVPQTTCDELRATKPSSALVPSYVDSSASSIVEASSACDHYTTVTDTNANGELTSQTRCIEYDNVSEIFLVSPSSDSDFMLSTSISSAISSSSICDRYSTIV
ncbi:uncharacterized protein ATC70_012813 [Mucor velutinosus]|uniref:Uncharacterized protein n=1 Tax=Mucor velutinosus TaxID=708070 RepID=A0AAN7HY49_9FUNG|nr:hypothetical protein ATC70_012813 [Mucor velutinosus]